MYLSWIGQIHYTKCIFFSTDSNEISVNICQEYYMAKDDKYVLVNLPGVKRPEAAGN